jgi:putative oxidoreductase
MKIAVLIARILLGLIFVFFGSNAFLHFMPAQLPPGVAGQYLGALFVSHYLYVIAAFQVIGGLLLLIGRYIPLGLVILAPILVNILAFHITMTGGAGILPGIVCTLLWFIVFAGHRSSFTGVLSANG